MKIKWSKIFIVIIFVLFFTNKTYAATLNIVPSKSNLGLGEQFFIDLVLDTEDDSLNTLEGEMYFPDNLVSLIGIEDYKSIIPLWLVEPRKENNSIKFTGVIPNGFNGVINPFDPSTKTAGNILRMIFEAKNTGKAEFKTSLFISNLNNGLGTEKNISPAYLSLNIEDFINKYIYDNKDEVSTPELEAYITRDPNIFNNKYILIFRAHDKGSGIRNVMVKEGWRGWKEIKSPYLLKDQLRHSDISLQATNNLGVSIILKLNKIPCDYMLFILFILIIIFIILLTLKIKSYKKNKNSHIS